MAEVKFKFVGDDSELRKKLADIARIQSEMSEKFTKDFAKTIDTGMAKAMRETATEAIRATKETEVLNKAFANNALTNAKIEQINSIKRLREERAKEISDLNVLRQLEQEAKAILAEKRAATEALNQAQKQAATELTNSRKALVEYNLEQKKASEEEKKATKALREAEKARKDAERSEKERAKQLERRKKQLAEESSEYFKLNKALGAVRKEAKDVLAEMFRMERQGYKNTLGYEALRQKAEGLTKQTQYLDRGIKKIDATLGLHQRNVGNYADAMEQMSPVISDINRKLAVFGTSIDELASKPGAIRELGTAFVAVGKGILTFLLSPIGLAVSALTGLFMLFQRNKQTVIDFEAGLRSISKTTGIVGQELRDLGQDIVQTSRRLEVVDATKLTELASAAGQLGVKGPKNILDFAEALAMLETASDISGEEGAKEIARMLTLVDGGVQNVKAFGDEIVNLGNNFAASEKEILSNAEAISQNVGIYRIGRQEVLAYATATKSLGVEAEVVGSTFQKTLGMFEKSIRSGKGVAEILNMVGGSAAGLQRRFREDASGVFQDYIKGLNEIHKSGGSVMAQMERNGIVDIRQRRVIATLATGYDTLARAMDTVRDASGAMQEEFENGAEKLVNQTRRIGIAWDNLVLSIEDGQGAIGKASVAIVGFFADILEEVNRLVTSDTWAEFFGRVSEIGMSGGGELKTVTDFKKGLEEIKRETVKIRETGGRFEVMTDAELKKEIEKFDQLKNSANELADHYQAALQVGRVQESSFFYSTAGKLSTFKREAKEVEDIYRRLNDVASRRGLTTTVSTPEATQPTEEESEKARQKRERAEEKARQKAERVAEQRRQAIERQRALQLQIDQLNEQAHRRQLSRDEQEVESIRDKYKKIREEARRFMADPRNKGLAVDMGGLSASEAREITDAREKQRNARMIASYQEDYQNYVRYEQLKKEAGEKYANEQLGQYADAVEKMQVEYARLQGKRAVSGLSFNEMEYLKQLETMVKGHNQRVEEEDRARFVESLRMSETFATQRLAIERRYQESFAALEKNRTSISAQEFDERKMALQEGLKNEVGAIAIAEMQKQVEWDKSFSYMQFMSHKATEKFLDDAQKRIDALLREGKITREQYDELSFGIGNARMQNNLEKGWIASTRALNTYRETLKRYGKDSKEAQKAQHDMFTSLARDLAGAQQIVGELGGLLSSLGAGDGVQQTVDQIGQVLGGMAELSAGIATGNPIAIISGSINLLSSAIELFNFKDKKIQKQIERYQRQLDDLGRSYSRLQDSINNAVGNEFYTKSNEAIANLREQQRLVEEMARKEGEKKKTDQDKVRQYLDEIEGINMEIEAIQRSITENLVQTTFRELSDNLANALVSAFEAGEDAIKSMDDVFDQFIKNALVNSLKLNLLQEPIDRMIEELSEHMLANDNSLEGFNFAPWKSVLDNAGKDFMKQLDSLYEGLGLSKTGGDTKKETIQGRINRNISEDTGSAILGFERARYEIASQHLKLVEEQAMVQQSILTLANDKLIALNAIQINTANTVQRLDTAVVHLQQIVRNTSSSTGRTAEGMGL